MRTQRSHDLFVEAQKYIPGGVNSPVRAFKSVNLEPRFIKKGQGAYVFDVDGNKYIDFVLGQGPLLLGHCHPVWVKAMTEQLSQGQLYAGQSELEIVLSEKLKDIIPGAELMRYGNSSSEIIQLALRIGRAHTGRQKWVKMEGHYHGWFDSVLASVHPTADEAGSSQSPNPVLLSSGQDKKVRDDILISHFNDLGHLEKNFIDC